MRFGEIWVWDGFQRVAVAMDLCFTMNFPALNVNVKKIYECYHFSIDIMFLITINFDISMYRSVLVKVHTFMVPIFWTEIWTVLVQQVELSSLTILSLYWPTFYIGINILTFLKKSACNTDEVQSFQTTKMLKCGWWLRIRCYSQHRLTNINIDKWTGVNATYGVNTSANTL